MAPTSCDPCGTCIPGNINSQYYRQASLTALCQILTALEATGGGATRYDYEALCAPDGTPVFVRWKYGTSGSVAGSAGYRADGTAYVGDLADLIACEASTVAVSSVIPGTGATNLGKAENAIFATGSSGVMSLSVSNEAAGIVAAADSDYTIQATNRYGAINVVLDLNLINSAVIGRQPVRAEDSAFANGEALMMAGGVNARSYLAYNSTNGDATPISVGDKGVVLSTLMYDSSLGGGSCAVVTEDVVISNGAAIVLVGVQRQDTPTTDTDASGDATQVKANTVGALYNEPANQVVVSALGTLAFGGVTTAYATLLTNSAKAKIVSFDNKLDKDVYISYNASTDHVLIAAGASKIFDYGSNGRWVASNISVKAIGANATTGNIYVSVAV